MSVVSHFQFYLCSYNNLFQITKLAKKMRSPTPRSAPVSNKLKFSVAETMMTLQDVELPADEIPTISLPSTAQPGSFVPVSIDT